METSKNFWRRAAALALPVTLQSLLQASFSVIDQCMTGQLGTVAVAGIGLGGKFAGIYTVMAAAVASGAGILIAQYEGRHDDAGVQRSFWLHALFCAVLAVGFAAAGGFAAGPILTLYTQDSATAAAGAAYLALLAPGFLPLAATNLLSTLLRCKGNARAPLYASLASAAANTGLNYLLIFGHAGFPKMGVEGAALATTIARFLELAGLVLFTVLELRRTNSSLKFAKSNSAFLRTAGTILLPILGCEFLWSLGENVYAIIYGRMGTQPCAAISLTNPVQSLMIGAMTGLSSAAGILVGQRLGEGRSEEAKHAAARLSLAGFAGAAALSCILALSARYYIRLFPVEAEVQQMTVYILYVYALVAPFKVENMILEGGVLRSGGKTAYVMGIDIIGTWCIGVPVGAAAGLLLHLPIWWTYLLLSLEECVRFCISLYVFRSGRWIQNLTQSN